MIAKDPNRQRNKELGVLLAMLERLNTYRMPRALELKERVDRGERLTNHDLDFLKRVTQEGAEARRLVAKHPKYQNVVDEMTTLYAEIMRKAVQNEEGSG